MREAAPIRQDPTESISRETAVNALRSALRRRCAYAWSVLLMVCAEACATGLRVDRRCESPLSNQAVVVVTDREGTKVPDAHVSIESLETGKKWYMDTDRTGAVRVNLAAGKYLIWGEFDRLRRSPSSFEVRACQTITD